MQIPGSENGAKEKRFMTEASTGGVKGQAQVAGFTSAADRPIAVFVLGLVSGLLIVAGSVAAILFYSFGPYHAYGPGYMGMMGGYYGGFYGMMSGLYFNTGLFYSMSVIGFASGLVILIGAVVAYSRPDSTLPWSVLVLVFSIISLVAMGGFFIGALLGFAAGVIGLTWHATRSVPGS